jgi:hypothetical protein
MQGILSDAIQSPFEKLMETRSTGTLSASLQIVVKLSIPDLLAATPDGLTIDEIAEKVPIDLGRIGSPVRLLTLMGWFKEGPGGRYTNTRLSELLREGGQGGNWIRASSVPPLPSPRFLASSLNHRAEKSGIESGCSRVKLYARTAGGSPGPHSILAPNLPMVQINISSTSYSKTKNALLYLPILWT